MTSILTVEYMVMQNSGYNMCYRELHKDVVLSSTLMEQISEWQVSVYCMRVAVHVCVCVCPCACDCVLA